MPIKENSKKKKKKKVDIFCNRHITSILHTYKFTTVVSHVMFLS